MATSQEKKTLKNYLTSFIGIALGAMLAAVSLRFFLFPNHLIDGGIIGISMILANLYGKEYVSYFIILLNVPFIFLSYKHIRKTFVLYMGTAVLLFALFIFLLDTFMFEVAPHFDPLEVVVIGGALLGIGAGLIIRCGGCTDGTEILAIILNKKKGFTVGQVVLAINVFIFLAYGLLFRDWHIALHSLMTYIIAFKMIDLVITGLDEMKSVMIISNKQEELRDLINQNSNFGMTILHGEGGFTGQAKKILFVIVERLNLAELKEIVLKTDPQAFMSIENLHEVVGKGVKYPALGKNKRKPKQA